MKIQKIYILLTALSFGLFSCSEGDVFTGSPVGTNVQFETLQGAISTSESDVVSGQSFPLTITLPQSFPVDVVVEATALITNSTKKTRKTFLIKANQTTVDVMMTAPGGDATSTLPFNLGVQVYLSAINTAASIDYPFGFAGKQYSLTSNVIDLGYGDSTFLAVNPNKLGVKLDFPGPYTGSTPNNLNLRVKRDGIVITVAGNSQTTAPVYGTTTASGRYEPININASAPDGEYTLEVFAAKLTTDPSDVPYRFVIRFPDETTKVIAGILPGLTVTPAAGAIPKLKIVKTTVGGQAHFEVSSL